MVIQLEGCKWRISGEGNDWQIQYPATEKGAETWRGKYFFPSLEFAVGKAYEIALKDSPTVASDMKAALAECKRVKTALVNAVKEGK